MRTTPRTSRLLTAIAAVALAVVACGEPATPTPSPAESPAAVLPTSPLPSSDPSTSPGDAPTPLASVPPSAIPTPSPSPSPSPSKGRAVATRVVVPALGIDLAVVKSPPAGVYPYCNVAMSFGKPLGQPGERRATYLFAHARDGMFGPIYNLAMVRRTPNVMVGMLVDVYTSDSKVHTYRITKVYLHQLTLNRAVAQRHDQLWLQTSEGPHGTPGKTQVVAEPVSVAAADAAASHPKVRIVHCGT